jgi:hypothetical protein
LFSVLSSNPDEDIAIAEDHQVVLVDATVLCTGLVEKVDLSPAICVQN